MSTLGIELRRHQLDHDDLMPDEIIPWLQVLWNRNAPSCVCKLILAPPRRGGEIDSGSPFRLLSPIFKPRLIDLEPDLLSLGVKLIARPITVGHVG